MTDINASIGNAVGTAVSAGVALSVLKATQDTLGNVTKKKKKGNMSNPLLSVRY